MNKIRLFTGLYRKRHLENSIICTLFILLCTMISMVLFVQLNNSALLQNQLLLMGIADEADNIGSLSAAYQTTENILGLIATVAMIVGAIGGFCLIGFRNQRAEKAIVVMHIYGMQMKDLCLKAAIDTALLGVLSSVLGYTCGYGFFHHFSRKILNARQVIDLFSLPSLFVFSKTLLFGLSVVFLGNLYMDSKIAGMSPCEYLYHRRASGRKFNHLFPLLLQFIWIPVYSTLVFHIDRSYLLVSGLALLLLSAVLFFLFHLIFGVFTKRRRSRMNIGSPRDLSFCFLCSRNRRDAALSIVISVGTMILCLAANILFNVGGMLRNAYRDNMGYSCVVFADNLIQKDEIKKALRENGFTYTLGYSKLMDYSRLNNTNLPEGKFWALVIAEQTDGNTHFSVPDGMFQCEKYFETQCGLTAGHNSEIFGKPVQYMGELTDNQYLSLVSYNFIVNTRDWGLGIDESFHPVFFLDTSTAEEKRLRELFDGNGCHIDSASELIDEIKTGMEEYLSVLTLVTGMIFLVTLAIFYTVIRSDLINRKTESYLYRIYGASFQTAQKIVFYEYLMIAFIASFAVSLAVMLCGELFFYCGLGKHFPLSIPIIAATTGAAVLFVAMCCLLAGKVNEKTTGLEAIRDE